LGFFYAYFFVLAHLWLPSRRNPAWQFLGEQYMARKSAAQAALSNPPATSPVAQLSLVGEVLPTNICRNCDHYTPKIIGDHGRCVHKPKTSMMKDTHVCAIDRFRAKA
jgi:hypothetical protein